MTKFTTKETEKFRKVFAAMEKAYANKVPTEKFAEVEQVLKSVQELAAKDDGEVTMEYNEDGVNITVINFMFGVAPTDMDKWREVCDRIDSIDMMATDDDNVSICFNINGIFKPA